MTGPQNVLLLSAGRRVELAQAIRADLAARLRHGKLIAADMRPQLSAACQVADVAVAVPRATDPTPSCWRGASCGDRCPPPRRWSVLAGAARTEAVQVVANMAIGVLQGGGCGERRGENRWRPSGSAGGGVSAAVVDGAGARARRVHDAPVRAGRAGGAAGLGPRGGGGDRHRPGGVGPVGRGPGRVRRAGGPGLHRRGRGDLRARDLPAGPLQRRGRPVDGVRGDHRDAADRRRRGRAPPARTVPDPDPPVSV